MSVPFIVFGFWDKVLWPIVEICSAVLPNKAFFVFLETLYIYLKILCSSWHVSTLIKKNSAHCRENFGRVVQTALYVSIETIRRKTLFWKKLEVFSKISEIEWKSFSILPKTTSVGAVKNEFKVSLKHFGAKNILFERNIIYKTCLFIEQKKSVCSKTFSAGLPKLLYMFQ